MNAWFAKVYEDHRLHSSHIALYLALFQYWNLNRFKNPITTYREELIRLSKIGSANTYTRCIKELDQWDYIRYESSFNPMVGSQVHLYSFDKGSGEAPVMVVRPYIKQSKQVKHKNSDVNQKKNFDEPL